MPHDPHMTNDPDNKTEKKRTILFTFYLIIKPICNECLLTSEIIFSNQHFLFNIIPLLISSTPIHRVFSFMSKAHWVVRSHKISKMDAHSLDKQTKTIISNRIEIRPIRSRYKLKPNRTSYFGSACKMLK